MSDLIKRQDALDALKARAEKSENHAVVAGILMSMNDIKHLPSADAEMNSKLFRIGEVLVEVSKEHITAEQGVKKIGVIMRGYDI